MELKDISLKLRNKIWISFIVFFVWFFINFVNINLFLNRDNKYWTDQYRYMGEADDMLKGKWHIQDNTMVCMPGYPFLLYLFRKIGLNYRIIRFFLNPLLLSISFIFFLLFLSLLNIENKLKYILFFSFSFFPSLIRYVHMFLTEIPSLVFLIVSVFLIYYGVFLHHEDKRKVYLYIIISGIFFAMLSYIRAQHGYIMFFMLFVYGIIYILSRQRIYLYVFLVFLVSVMLLIPYLCFTYKITGIFPYFTNKAGESLYFMSYVSSHEFGDHPGGKIYTEEKLLHHGELFDSLEGLPQYKRDVFFKKYAMNNIIHHPFNYIKNLFFNFLRLTTGGPYSYQLCSWKKRFLYSIGNFFLLVITLFVVGKYRVIDKFSVFLYLYVFVLFVLTILPSTFPRFFVPFVGLFFFIIGYNLGKKNE